MSAWSPEYLSKHPSLLSLATVKQHPHRIVTFYEKNAPLELVEVGKIGDWKRAKKDIVSMKTSEFFKRIENASDTNYYYYSEEIRAIDKSGGLMSDISPTDWFHPTRKIPDYVGIWMGGRGVTARYPTTSS